MAVSRLWRKLGLTQPLLSVWSENPENFAAMSDHDIRTITISRGSSVTGTQEHTMEVNTAVSRPVRTDRPLHCDLTTYGANRLAELVGADATEIKPRYFGRIGRQTLDDIGTPWGPDNWFTSLYCSKWQSQLENSDRIGNQISGEPVTYLFDHFMNPQYSNLDHMPAAEFPAIGSEYGTMINEYDLGEAKIPYSEFVSKYFDAPGFYVQNTRRGADRVLTLAYRKSVADNRRDSWIPLTRSQALAPTTWDQPNENRPRNHQTWFRDSAGLKYVVTGPDVNDVRVPLVEHDVSHIQFVSDYQPRHRGYLAYAAERSDSGYSLPELRIDLLHLITSENAAYRRQALQLLHMEMGDPVYLSGDWYWDLQGVHYATGIKEQLSADKWEITLTLTPSSVTVGTSDSYVSPRVWESARFPWSEATETWAG